MEIADIGNCYIQANNDDLDEWYMAISTSLGWTTIITYGPLDIDSDDLKNYFNYNYSKIEFDEKKIHKAIFSFLNNPKNNITQAEEIDYDQFKNRLVSLDVFNI